MKEKLYNISYLEEISGGDDVFINEMLVEFINNAPGVLKSIKENSNAKNYSELYANIHRFAPNFDFVGNPNVKLNVNMLESASKHMRNLDKIDSYIQIIDQITNTIIAELKKDYNL